VRDDAAVALGDGGLRLIKERNVALFDLRFCVAFQSLLVMYLRLF
jgi:hypothetical protein